MNLSTTPYLYGSEITDTCGLVSADVVYGANAVRDFFAKFKDFTGGSVRGYQSIYEKAKQEAIEKMINDAKEMGGNAIVGIDFQINALGEDNTILQLSAHGTAVVASRNKS